VKTHGEDSFGQFWIKPGWCSKCDLNCEVTIQYKPNKLILPHGIEVQKTILARDSRVLGLDCGCYAKFHRQVAHIVDNMRMKVPNGDPLPERMRD
jgi:hypothetical protein